MSRVYTSRPEDRVDAWVVGVFLVVVAFMTALVVPALVHEHRQEIRCEQAGGEFVDLPRDYDGLCLDPGTVVEP